MVINSKRNNRLLGVLWPLLLDMALHHSCMMVIDVEKMQVFIKCHFQRGDPELKCRKSHAPHFQSKHPAINPALQLPCPVRKHDFLKKPRKLSDGGK